jgi:hypothetical protein
MRKIGQDATLVVGKRTAEDDVEFDEDAKRSPKKKLRILTNLDVTYDKSGTPILSNIPVTAPPAVQAFKDSANVQTLRTLFLPPGTIPPAPRTGIRTPDELTPFLGTPTAGKKRKFNIIDAFCRDNALLLTFVSYLPIPSLISLYAISKPFHFLFNRHHTAYILSNMRTWAPGSDKIFPWRCYKSLCAKDPHKNHKLRLVGKEKKIWEQKYSELRDVPGLRWLQMVVWREGISRDMLIQLRVQGLRCPPETLEAVKKMWFLLDLPLNSHRIATIHSREYITDENLELMTHFLLKVDMFFSDPLRPAFPANHPRQRIYPNRYAGRAQSGVPFRRLLISEKSFTPLWRVIRGWAWDPTDPPRPMTRLDGLRLWVTHNITFPEGVPDDEKEEDFMGVPWYELGTMSLERTGVSFFDLTPPKPKDDDAPKPARRLAAVTVESFMEHYMPLFTQQQAQVSVNTNHNQPTLPPGQLLYPHAKQLHLMHEKPRERLMRADQLIIRECFKRGIKQHEKWLGMVLWGFCDRTGRDYPIEMEEEILKKLRGEKVEKKPRQIMIWEELKRAEKGEEDDDDENAIGRDGGEEGITGEELEAMMEEEDEEDEESDEDEDDDGEMEMDDGPEA